MWILNTSEECLCVYKCIGNIHKGGICLSIERRDKTPLRAPIIIIVSFTFYLSLIYIFIIKPHFIITTYTKLSADDLYTWRTYRRNQRAVRGFVYNTNSSIHNMCIIRVAKIFFDLFKTQFSDFSAITCYERPKKWLTPTTIYTQFDSSFQLLFKGHKQYE